MYEDLELWYPLIRLKEAGAEVSVVAPTAGATYKSKHGLEVKADLSADGAKAKQFDAVVIPGGFGWPKTSLWGARYWLLYGTFSVYLNQGQRGNA